MSAKNPQSHILTSLGALMPQEEMLEIAREKKSLY
ncbi:MAG: hypothetical protein ACI85F_002424, partial [Bacteroidia bacterium]